VCCVAQVELLDDLGERGALGGLLGPAQFHEVDYVSRGICGDRSKREALPRANGLDDLHGMSTLPWLLAEHELPQNHCVAENVCLFSVMRAIEYFGSSPRDGTTLGHGLDVGLDARKSEIGNFHFPICCDQHIGALDVAVNNAMFVEVREARGDVLRNSFFVLPVQVVVLVIKHVGQTASLQVLGNEAEIGGLDAHSDEPQNIWMLQFT